MSDFEDRLSRTLEEHAEAAPGVDGLSEGARVRHRRRRVAQAGLAGAAVVAVVAAVPLGLGSFGSGGSSNEPGVATTGLGSPPAPPDGWRFESYHDVEFAVPDTWQYGSLSDWCAGPGGQGDPVPRVERPNMVVLDIYCSTSGYGVVVGDAPTNPPAGAAVRSATAGGVTISVVAKSQDVADGVADSLREIQGLDAHGCAPQVAVPALGDMAPTGDVDRTAPASLCRYELGVRGANLVSSEVVTSGDDLDSLWLGFESAEPGSGPDASPANCGGWNEDEATLVRSAGADVAWVHYGGCAGHGVDEGGTTYKLNAQVMYWALPPGGFGVDGSVPLPKEMRLR
jgi:hypothetical protein